MSLSMCIAFLGVRYGPRRHLPIRIKPLLLTELRPQSYGILLFLIVKHLISDQTVSIADFDATSMLVWNTFNRCMRHSTFVSHRSWGLLGAAIHRTEVILGG